MHVRRSGFALIIVLIVTAALFAVAMQSGLALRAAITETIAVRDLAQLQNDASSAVAVVLAGLTTPANPDTLGGQDPFSVPSSPASTSPIEAPDIPDLPPEIRDLLAQMLDDAQDNNDNTPPVSSNSTSSAAQKPAQGPYTVMSRVGLPAHRVEVTIGDHRFAVSLADAAQRLNINHVGPEQLAKYFKAKGYPKPLTIALAHQIIDWRDDDDFLLPSGAERQEYLRRGVVIRNAPFRTIYELLYLPAMTRQIFDDIRADLTLTGDGQIHVGSAPRAVLLSIPSMTPTAADQIMALRQQGQLTEQTLANAVAVMSRQAKLQLRLEPTIFLRIDVELVSRDVTGFVGYAIISNTRIQTIKLAPAVERITNRALDHEA